VGGCNSGDDSAKTSATAIYDLCFVQELIRFSDCALSMAVSRCERFRTAPLRALSPTGLFTATIAFS
jgi:hypothetical protein